MRAITQARWNAFAGFCRRPMAALVAQEIAWFEADDERVVATLIVDDDQEFSGIVLARDLVERFRFVAITGYHATPEDAIFDLDRKISSVLPQLETARVQGDEPRVTVDFFAPLTEDRKLNPAFRTLSTGDGYSAAREIITVMMRWHEDIDGNFVEQFQTTGFDARLWELYLFAALVESGLEVSHPKPAPDFLARGLSGEFTIEATTINPSAGGSTPEPDPADLETDEGRARYHFHYLPIKYAGPLTAKLRKEYWKRPSAVGKPFVIAIQDFHARMSMAYSGSALPIYLYGVTHSVERKTDGKLNVKTCKITEHTWGSKVVPSGFFSLPDAENVSAVIFNSSGTISKFNRMGVCAGFGLKNVILIRRGHAWNPDPDAVAPSPYVHIVTEENPETWVEGMDVFHNPNALLPLDPSLLPGAAHHWLLEDGRIETVSAGWKPMDSVTTILTLPGAS